MSVRFPATPPVYDDGTRGGRAGARSNRQTRVVELGEAVTEAVDSLSPDFEDMADVEDFVSSRRSRED